MKTTRIILITLITFFAASAIPAAAQLPHDFAEADIKNSPDKQIKLLPKAAPQSGKKNSKGKTPVPKRVSEYKFERIDHKPAYAFDRKANPIIKGPKLKKKAVKKTAQGQRAAAAAKTAPETQAAKPAEGSGQGGGGSEFSKGNSSQTTQDQPEE